MAGFARLNPPVHGHRSVGGHGAFPLFFKVEGRPLFCHPYFFGVDIFVLMHTVFDR